MDLVNPRFSNCSLASQLQQAVELFCMAAQPRKIQKFDLHTLGTYPSLTQEMPDNEIQVIRKF
jgi:hypothetical protein